MDNLDGPVPGPGRSVTMKAVLDRLAATHNPRRLGADPVAVVGLDCVFPGADDAAAFWRLLWEGRDAVGQVPAGRWDTRDLPAHLCLGGFLQRDVYAFDAAFFGLSPREARHVDPQHRLALETAWHALEDAGLCREELAGSRTGVYASVYQRDYARMALSEPRIIDAYTASGTHHSIAANRLSYLLDLRAPSLTVDTACSSSLVAVAMACQALLDRQVDRAVVLASNLMLEPNESVSLSRWGMLAVDGRCKTFDARADGFVRGEGCGAVVLERLRDARTAGRRVRAVIQGAAVNQDGRSNGLTAPNGLAQQAVIREALADARVDPSRISYVEAHGTGTALGDPIEVEALASVLGSGEPHPGCLVGSVKTNIGHLEAAAGVAGLIKVVLALEHGAVPPSLHYTSLNPNITLEGTPLCVASEHLGWQRQGGEPRMAGVSAFGMGGTNAHVVLREATESEQPDRAPAVEGRAELLVLSAHEPAALESLARATLSAALDAAPDDPLAELCAAACRRTHHSHRLCVAATDGEMLRQGLEEWLESGPAEASARDGEKNTRARPAVVFVFPGQGSQWAGMGRGLMSEPAFAEAMGRCDETLAALEGWSLLETLQAPGTDPRLERIEIIQPMLLAMQVSLAALWRSWGVCPDAVVGHSMGEAAAAHVAGALSLDDAMRLIARRSRLMTGLRGSGSMAAVSLGEEQARQALAGLEGQVSVAAVNGPVDTVLSGEGDALARVMETLESRGVRCRPIAVDVASHNPAMDSLAGPLARELAGLRPRAAEVPLYSTVLGQVVQGGELNADYWVRNLRQTVRLHDAVTLLRQHGHDAFVEVSPHPVLLAALGQGLAPGALLLPSGRRGGDERLEMLAGLGRLHERGLPLSWETLYPRPGRSCLPRYPFQRQPHKLPQASASSRPRIGPAGSGNPLLGRAMELAQEPGQALFELTLDAGALPFVDDHAVEGERVLPGTGAVEIVSAAARARWPGEVMALVDVVFHRPILLPPEPLELQVWFHGRCFELAGRHGEGWTLRISGRVEPAGPGEALDTGEVRERCAAERSGAELYQRLDATGNRWGPAFQGVRELWRRDGEVLARVQAPEQIAGDVARHLFHPALLDACGQALVEVNEEFTGPFVLASLDRVATFAAPGVGALWAHITERGEGEGEGKGEGTGRGTGRGKGKGRGKGRGKGKGKGRGKGVGIGRSLVGDVLIYDEQGSPVAEMIGLCIRFLHHAADRDHIPGSVDRWLYEVCWDRAAPVAEDQTPDDDVGSWLGVPDRGGVAAQLELGMWSPAPGKDSRNVAFLAGLDLAPGPDATAADVQSGVLETCWSALERCREVCSRGWRLWLVTRGAVHVTDGDVVDPAQACLWGLGQVMAAEHPACFGGIVDLDPRDSTGDASRQLTALLRDSAASRVEPRVALRAGQRLVPRLQRVARQPHSAVSLETLLRPDGAYLITGGLGALGLRVARRLVRLGARRLILLGRGTLPPRELWRGLLEPDQEAVIAAVLELESMGAHVELVGADVGDQQAMDNIAARRRWQKLQLIRGVVHAAGVQHPAAVAEMDRQQLERELRAKVAGTLALWRALGSGGELDFLVLFSSTATLLDSPLLGGYTAANAFLDAFAQARRAAGQRVYAVDWGVWEEVGMARRYADVTGRELVGRGVGSMAPERALDALEQVIALDSARVGVMPMDWQRWGESHPEAARAAYMSRVTEAEGEPDRAATPAAGGSLTEELAGLEGEERRSLLEQHVRARLARVLHASVEAVVLDHPLTRLGLDSLMALELRNRLEADAGVTVGVVFILQCASVRQLAARLDQELATAHNEDGEWEEVTI